MHYRFNATGVSLSDIERAIQERWSSISRDPVLQSMARDREIPLSGLALEGPCPYLVMQEREGFGIVDDFVVVIAATVTAEYAIRALDELWLHIFKPRLEQMWGRNLRGRPGTSGSTGDAEEGP